jgi:hypothetical protein
MTVDNKTYFEIRSGGPLMNQPATCKIVRPNKKRDRVYRYITPASFKRVLRLDDSPLIELEDNTIVIFGKVKTSTVKEQ